MDSKWIYAIIVALFCFGWIVNKIGEKNRWW